MNEFERNFFNIQYIYIYIVVLVTVTFMGQIDLFKNYWIGIFEIIYNCIQKIYVKNSYLNLCL